MAKNTQKKAKDARRELAKKQAKQRKTTITITVAAVVALALVAVIVIFAVRSARTETYTDGEQSVQLLPDGTFTAIISHGTEYSGTYIKTEQEGSTLVTYTTAVGQTVSGEIANDQLLIPAAWLDEHSHNSVLPKK